MRREALAQGAWPRYVAPRPRGASSAQPRGHRPAAPTVEARQARAERVHVGAGRGRAAAKQAAAQPERTGKVGCLPTCRACSAGLRWIVTRSQPPRPPPPPRRRSGRRYRQHVPTGSSSAPRWRPPPTSPRRRGTPLRSTRGRPGGEAGAAASRAAAGSAQGRHEAQGPTQQRHGRRGSAQPRHGQRGGSGGHAGGRGPRWGVTRPPAACARVGSAARSRLQPTCGVPGDAPMGVVRDVIGGSLLP